MVSYFKILFSIKILFNFKSFSHNISSFFLKVHQIFCNLPRKLNSTGLLDLIRDVWQTFKNHSQFFQCGKRLSNVPLWQNYYSISWIFHRISITFRLHCTCIRRNVLFAYIVLKISLSSIDLSDFSITIAKVYSDKNELNSLLARSRSFRK